MSPTERSRTLERLFDTWWPHLRDMASALLGGYFLWHEVVLVDEADPLILTAGLVLLGITGSGIAQRVLDKDNG